MLSSRNACHCLRIIMGGAALYVLLVAAAHGQTFTCPQVVLAEAHTCLVGSCKGQYSVNNCDTTNNTSSFQCVFQIPTCCGQQQKAFNSATEGADCTGSGCDSLLREPPLLSPTRSAPKPTANTSGGPTGSTGGKAKPDDSADAKVPKKEAKS